MMATLLGLVLAFGLVAEQPQATNTRPSDDPSQSGDNASPAKSVKPEDPVITVRGICDSKDSKNKDDNNKDRSMKSADSADCKTIVTREQFERLTAAVATTGQPVPGNSRRQLAQTYVDLLAYEQAARPSGTESSPEFRDLMELIRLRTLAEVHRRNLQARYHAPSAQDIDDYYRQNLSSFIDIRLRRILLPRKNPAAGNQEQYEKRALQVANDLRERAAKGEDPEKLQREGYTTLGLTSPPGTDMGSRRRANLLPEARDEILALSAGGVSTVQPENFSFVIYKVEGKNLLGKEMVKEEISREISRQRLETALKEITSGVQAEFNQQYFPPAPSQPANPPAASPPGSQQPSSRAPQK